MVIKPRGAGGVEFGYLDHEVMIDSNKHRAAGQWCEQQFGNRWNPLNHRQGLWTMFWSGPAEFNKYRFCFATEQDMVLFSLRW